LAALIQVSRPQNYNKRTFRSVAHWHFLLNELHPRKCKVSGCTQNTELQNSYQLDSWWLFCPGSSFWVP